MVRRTLFRSITMPLVAAATILCLASSALAQLTPADIDALRKQGEQEGWTFTVGESAATAVSLEQLCGLVEPENWWKDAPFDPCPPTRDLPDQFDWRDYGGCTPVRNQGSCGSCWAFGTVGPLECNILIKDGIVRDLSEQWLVSCNREGYGCGGGWWVHEYHEWQTDACGGTGAVLEADFPYVAYDAPCNCPYPHEYLIDGWAFVGSQNGIPPVNNMKQAILDYGPISVAVYVNSAFHAYTGGVFNGCSSGQCNHAVVLVGWDDNQGSGGVWFMRNSWGPTWGEGGYMRIPYGCSNVGYSACYVDYAGSSAIAFEYPNGLPDMLTPGHETAIRVNVVSAGGEPQPGTGMQYYRIDGGSFHSASMTQLQPNQYEARFPGLTCGSLLEYYFSAQEQGGATFTDPRSAPASMYSAPAAFGTIVIMDDTFETDQGWSVYAGADIGDWERGDPEEVEFWDWDTWSYVTSQPENDHTVSGTKCYVTGRLSGSDAGSYDVDGGPSRLTSPTLDLSQAGGTVSYWRWYHISTELNDALTVEVSNDNGGSWTTVETVTSRQEWTYVEWDVAEYVTPTSQVKVRFTVDDTPNDSLVEALIDDFKVLGYDCEADCLPDLTGDRVVDQADLGILLADWGCSGSGCVGDCDGDGDTDQGDLGMMLAWWGPCP